MTALPPSEPTLPDVIRVLRDDGTAVPEHDPGLSPDELVALYRATLLVRLVDERLSALFREGRVGFHAGHAGDEGFLAGAALAVRASDWVFPGARDLATALVRGASIDRYFARAMGNAVDPCKGRLMPDQGGFREAHVLPTASPLGAHVTHAVGAAWAARSCGDDSVALALVGESGGESGDLHNALNFAGVFRAPVVFACRGGAAESVASRGVAYGVEAWRCDGSDALAVLSAVRRAAARARAGEGPVLLECVFAPDPSKRHDPLGRLRGHLERAGVLAEGAHQSLAAAISSSIDDGVERARRVGPPALESMFDDVFAAPPWHLIEQRAEALRAPRSKGRRSP